ncbi:response regulator [Comamonas piscis]|uniref:Virulence sensor protein BvgS n=1 Tax=Comamonas piscis TaxID=1562974 RepID=A0A7G5EK52_9BURK|nr:response regulator [Comamonas piscis]QMV74377.1 response regulator [Comamonas piscis]WSO32826.1 response regulator [Comamonas piscis]
MPQSRSSQQRSLFPLPLPMLLGFAAAAIAALVIAIVNVYSADVRARAVTSIDRMTAAMRQLNEFSVSLKDAETGQRGFLLTGDPAYLQPYRRAQDALEGQLRGLAASNNNAPLRQERVQAIDALAHQKLAELEATIELKQAGRGDEALALVRTDKGKLVMDELNSEVANLYLLQNNELDQRRRAWEQAAITSTYISWGGSLVMLVLVLVSAALSMREFRAKARQAWVSDGLGGLNQALQGDHRLEEVGARALDYLASYLGARVGAGYARHGMDDRYQLFGGYALPKDALQAHLLAGEGLAGQVLRNGKLLKVGGLNQSHLKITSSTGESQPLELVLAPAVENGKVHALIELGFARPVTQPELDLLEAASSTLAIAVRSAIDRSRLENLLEETRQQSEELLVQQEEMRASNEELEQQSQVLQRSQAQMEQQQSELEQTNAYLEEQTQKLEHQREQLLRAKDALTDKARELEVASQYKSEFLANMSHELRTPLNSTLILAKLLGDNKLGNLTGEQVKYAQTIYAAGNDLLALINDILDLAKIEAGQANVVLEPINLSTSMQSLIEPLRPMAQQKGLALTCHIAPGVPAYTQTDGLRLGQILKNLLSNAIKFTERGSVNLQLTQSQPGTLTFAVHDTGIGIPEHQQQLIFEAFQQADGSTHRKYGGTGLGLSIARDLAHLLGGQVSVQSTPGQGSVFSFHMPLVQAGTPTAEVPMVPKAADALRALQAAPIPAPIRTMAPATAPRSMATYAMADTSGVATATATATAAPATAVAAAADALALPTIIQGRHLLVVEDDPRFADILQELAREMGFSCQVARNAADGLSAAVQFLPNAIVLDINLPDFSGLGVLDQLKRNPATRHIPVHIVSVADYSQEALVRGALGYALKPVQREELAQALKRLEAKFTQNMHRVLLVEDDERQRDSVHSLLGNSEVDVVCAGTAGQALEYLAQGTYDCMIMDLNLPDMSGFALLERMSEQDGVSFPPVIVYTGRALSRDEETQLRRFSHSIIIKDARSPERLLDEVTLFLHQVESRLSPEHQQMLAQARSREAALEGRKVLVVEDDVRNVFALTSILEPTGIAVEIARNGREALEVLDREDNGVDLVLMDIMMPEMDGYTAMREIRGRQALKRLPIIALTAKAMKDDQEKCLAAGANDYIAKPLDVEKLLSLVRVWMPK